MPSLLAKGIIFLKITEKLAIMRLIRTQNIGPVTLTMLLRRYKTGSAVLEQLPEISKRSRISLNISTQSAAEDEIAAAEKIGAQIIVRGEDAYPKSLAMFDDAPGCLTCLGHLHLLQNPRFLSWDQETLRLTHLILLSFCVVRSDKRAIPLFLAWRGALMRRPMKVH